MCALLHVCVCVCVCMQLDVCIHVYIVACMYVCVCVCVYSWVCVHACVHCCMYLCVSVCVNLCVLFFLPGFVVYVSDRGDDVLRLANLNVDHNSHLLQNGDVRVREMDWTAKAPLEADSEGEEKDLKARKGLWPEQVSILPLLIIVVNTAHNSESKFS